LEIADRDAVGGCAAEGGEIESLDIAWEASWRIVRLEGV